jgi:RNA polymerase sigma factor (sigma-70 family)
MKIVYKFFSIFQGNRYETPQKLYEGLKAEENGAINILMEKITNHVLTNARNNNLSEEQIKDIILTAVMKHIECIRSGEYTFDGGCPSRFAKEIANNYIRHTWRKSKLVSFEDAEPISDPAQPNASKTEEEDKLFSLNNGFKIESIDEREIYENREIIQKALSKLNPAERNLILQKYSEGYSDEELLGAAYNTEQTRILRKVRQRARYQFQYWWLYYMDLLAPTDAPQFKRTAQSREIVAQAYLEQQKKKCLINQRDPSQSK